MFHFQKLAPIYLIVLSLVLITHDLNAQVFYVSPEGNDDNPGTEVSPFQTIGKAKQCVRAINRDMNADIVVYLRGGDYSQNQSLEFDARDSGKNGHSVIYRNYSNEKPIVSGGRKITGWQQESPKLWKARPGINAFRQLYVNGSRAVRSKGGPLPGAQLYGASGYKTTAAEMAKWTNPGDIELIYDVKWQRCICKVGNITPADDGAILGMLEPYFTLLKLKDGPDIEMPTSVENAFELLDEPGEWYFNKATGWLYYMPRVGEQMDHCQVIAPALEELVGVRGTLDEPAEDLRFEGLTFCYAGWNQPSSIGHVDVQSNFTIGQQNLLFRFGSAQKGMDEATNLGLGGGRTSIRVVAPYGEAVKSPSNVVLRSAHRIHFERCTFSKLGGGGIDIEYGSKDNTICGCSFYDISGSAIQIGDVIDHHPQDAREVVKNNHIVNNVIHDVAIQYLSGVGIFVGYTDGTLISHNDISNLPYSGVSMGWGWGEADAGGGAYWLPSYFKEPTVCRNNVCEKNNIHNICQRMWDGAGVYTLGNLPGSVIRENIIRGSKGWPGGIYLDEGTGFIEIVGNIIDDVPSPIFCNNRAQNRIDTCKQHDNYESVKPEDPSFPRSIANEAGPEAAYHDLLAQ
jgi:hypothetical protein